MAGAWWGGKGEKGMCGVGNEWNSIKTTMWSDNLSSSSTFLVVKMTFSFFGCCAECDELVRVLSKIEPVEWIGNWERGRVDWVLGI